jgi:PIN domain nuclease of toxin-antitoxin system
VRVLLDTHAFLWWVLEDPRLSAGARSVIAAPETDVVVSAVSAWEIAIKAADHRLDLPEPAQTYVPDRIAANGFRELQVTVEHAIGVAGLPPIHRDPFDRLLVAQAQVEGIPIVTSDPAIARYDVDVIW